MTTVTDPAMRTRTPHDIREHKDVLIQAEADGILSANSSFATVSNQEWFIQLKGTGTVPTRLRIETQEKILEEFWRTPSEVPMGRIALVMAGPPGAGKSTAEKRVRMELAPGQPWRKIDPDHFKDLLLRWAFKHGEYETIVPPELHEDRARAYLRELAALVHEESSILAARARTESISKGENLVIDGTQKTYTKTKRLIDHLLDARYSISLMDVEVGFAISLQRVEARWAKGYNEAEESYIDGGSLVDHLGGRWVPHHCVADIYHGGRADTTSVCQQVVGRLVAEYPGIRIRVESNN
ncbi:MULTISPECIES: zeta toxin family protein [unclassified Streptomyces]|uniref:zeta toxin family protein n=1 Tax=unclassified Streptomyces TaxID=2593676 RepID=UPI003D755C8D